MRLLYRLLEHPRVYEAFQRLLAPGAGQALARELGEIKREVTGGSLALDVGCGPHSHLWQVGLRPIGVDISVDYTHAFAQQGARSVVASADALPFRDASVDSAWTIGLLHHLPDADARQAVQEMVRSTRPGGDVVVFDGLLPDSIWRNPYVWLQRKLDRGRYMRSRGVLESLLTSQATWRFRRVSYSLVGHEGLICVLRKAGSTA
jgi:ubiquinone/menaquinone biosynthesis C-methylase UbiE